MVYMNEKLTKPYSPKETEERIYALWEKSGVFNPDTCIKKGFSDKNAKPFSIVLPPPNVTGVLHMGHSEMLALEDILVRYNRMQKKPTLWIPGTDHAAIATQAKVEKTLYESSGKTRHDTGKDEFLKQVEEFAKESHSTITEQIKRVGSSLDWSREAFTLDEDRTVAVRTAFKRMYDDGLIYRSNRIVNWCPHCKSTLSDDEVEHKPKKATLYTFKYSQDFPFSIATTRPETKFGDTAVAVHPDDTRYKKYIGQSFTVDIGRGAQNILIIGDDFVDPDFGTGALGVTPAHSVVDYEMAQKHNLPIVKILDEDGLMTEKAGKLYAGLKIKAARIKFVEWLSENNLIEKEEIIDQNLSACYRCARPVEPIPSLQWFIDVNKPFIMKDSKIKTIKTGDKTTLKKLMRTVVENEQVKIIPNRFEKTYYHWIDNLRDWCISRQIWYGHQIPVWYKEKNNYNSSKDAEIYVGINPPEGLGWTQDSDTLDTWFSSGLWTFSTLGWPNKTEDLKSYHPTSVLETGYDILFFWVARMILMSTYLLGDIPFKTVYLHGLVRDNKGKKMSKSLGNAVNPIDMIEKYGADATRMSLIIGTSPGNDIKLSEDKIKGYKHFANKIWNIARFIDMNSEELNTVQSPEILDSDRLYIKEIDELSQDVAKEIECYHFYLAAEKLYHYTWNRLASEIIEESKSVLNGEDKKARISRKLVLNNLLKTLLKLLHPFMPFITEELWGTMYDKNNLLIVEPWPNQ